MVKSEDLRGQLSGFPLAIARLMAIRQFQQTGEIRPDVFQRNRTACRTSGGFEWGSTPEGDDMWDRVVYYRRYHTFPLHFTNDIAIFPNPQLISDCYGKTT